MSIKNAGTGKKKIERIAIIPAANPMSRELLRSPCANLADETSAIPFSPERYPSQCVDAALRGDGAARARSGNTHWKESQGLRLENAREAGFRFCAGAIAGSACLDQPACSKRLESNCWLVPGGRRRSAKILSRSANRPAPFDRGPAASALVSSLTACCNARLS